MSFLGRNPDFRKLWLGQSISLIGDQIAIFVIPTSAILLFQASGTQTGLLNASFYIWYPLIGLFVGVLLDRIKRRPVLLAADAIRLVAFLAISILSISEALTFASLLAVTATAGLAAVFFDIAYQSYVPSIVPASDLVNGNARLEFSQTVAKFCGPSLGGMVFQILGATVSFAVTTLSFGASLVGLAFIRQREKITTSKPQETRNIWGDLIAGWMKVFTNPILRSTTLTAALRNCGMMMVRTTFLLFAYKAVGLSVTLTGVVLAAGTAAAVFGSLFALRISNRLGLGKSLIVGALVEGVAWTCAPLALLGAPVSVLIFIAIVASLWAPIWNINVLTLRQTIVPPEFRGRANAVARTITTAMIPVGAAAGGVIADLFTGAAGTVKGLSIAVIVSGSLATASFLPLMAAPIRKLHSLPTQAVD